MLLNFTIFVFFFIILTKRRGPCSHVHILPLQNVACLALNCLVWFVRHFDNPRKWAFNLCSVFKCLEITRTHLRCDVLKYTTRIPSRSHWVNPAPLTDALRCCKLMNARQVNLVCSTSVTIIFERDCRSAILFIRARAEQISSV